MARDLRVQIVGDASSLQKALDKAGTATNGFGSKLGGIAKTAGLAAGATGLGAIAYTLKAGIDEYSQSSKVAAQTQAVIKSTGGAANVTAKQVDRLSTSLMNKSGADDEAIKTGANMLLTFTNVRNEAGKGNDIFDQATKTLLDMSTAMNGGAIPSAEQLSKQAIQLGKALNDPTTGMTALHRVGVSFTDAQKAQVAAMVKAGDTMGAQKLILHELNKEFGGSADAIGKTLPGQISILRENFNNLAGDIVTKMAPKLNEAVGFLSDHSAQIGAVITAVFDGIGWAATNVIGPAFAFLIKAGQQVIDWTQANWPQISAIATKVFDNTRAVVVGFTTAVQAVWDKFGSTIIDVVKTDLRFVENTFRNFFEVARGIIDVFAGLLHGDWSRVWNGIKEIFGGVTRQILNVADTFGHLLADSMRIAGTLALDALKIPLNAAKALASSIFDGIVGAVKAFRSLLGNAARDAGSAFVHGLEAGFAGIGKMLESAITAPINALIGRIDAIHIDIPKVHIPFVGDVGGGSFGFNIPKLAKGTDLVRAAGLAYLHAGEQVMPARVAGGGYSGGQRPIVNNFTINAGMGADGHLIGRQIREALVNLGRVEPLGLPA
jgi:hypothetical protein